MGLFDTIILNPPRRCRNCGAEIDQVQTKAWEPGLREYRVGDIISGSPIVSGVISEGLYCAHCNTTPQQVYFAIWHSLLVGVHDAVDEAERRIGDVDRAELLDYLERHQKNALQWHDRFSRLYGELQNLHDYQSGEYQAGAEGKSVDLRFFRIRDFIASDDPMSALIEANRPVNPEDETEVGSGDDET